MTDQIQSRLLRLAAIFLFIHSIILTLSPAGRERSWDVELKYSHWTAYLAWAILILIAHAASKKLILERDPYILPSAALLSGWGLLTIWRLDQSFGLRQMVWFMVAISLFIAAMKLPRKLGFLRRYKYLLLSSGLLLTFLTLILGTNPLGNGPRLWLGCCGVYFQPSEPLKLLLVIYLAAYFSDKRATTQTTLPLLAPTMILTGTALLLLLAQKDLGTATIFIFIFTIILFIVTGRKGVLLGSVFMLALALWVGYYFIDVIHIRVDGWINPWKDPSGESYQIIQSLLAIANGGIIGRGPGMGNPLLVPVAISDFIFSAIAEENGLIGIIGLLIIYWLILARGIIIALRAADRFRRYLAIGIVSYFGAQSLLIIGGNLRVLPLTGVTLPFISYGGSSLLTSYLAILLLLIISCTDEHEPTNLADPAPYLTLSGILALFITITALASAWWIIVRGSDLLSRTDNGRRAISDRYVPRGRILDRNNVPIDINIGESGFYTRKYLYPDLAPVTGYTNPVYGQAGLEASLDPYLRGMQGNPTSMIWWDHLLYGTPPQGLDARLSIDLNLQTEADRLLDHRTGALILINAKTGEILVMASHPTFDPNTLDRTATTLIQDPQASLVNRAAQGLYPIGTSADPLLMSKFGDLKIRDSQARIFYKSLGFYQAPQINLPATVDIQTATRTDLRVSPLHIAVAMTALSNHGRVVAPQIAMAVNSPQQGWVILPPAGSPHTVLPSSAADKTASSLIVPGKPYWSYENIVKINKSTTTWIMAGTLPDWGGTPLVIVLTLEENNPTLARLIQDQFLAAVLK